MKHVRNLKKPVIAKKVIKLMWIIGYLQGKSLYVHSIFGLCCASQWVVYNQLSLMRFNES